MPFDDHLTEDELEKLRVACIISLILIIFACAVVFVITCILLLVTCRRKTFSHLPSIVKLCLILSFLQVAYNLAIEITALVKYPLYWEASELTLWQGLSQILALTWLMLMWHFAAHYMKTACLFKKTFQARQDEDFEELQRQKAHLLSLEWGFQAIQIVVSALWFIYYDDVEPMKMNLVSYIINMISIVIISIVALLSQHYIQKHSAPVEKLGIKTYANIMRF